MRAVRLYVALLVLAPASALADFSGPVVHVQDGDTLTVLVDKRQVKVRLDTIDAPELKQAFGQRSKQSLLEICGGKAAQVADRGKDRYGRTIGRVGCAGVDANTEQVRRGMAWVFREVRASQFPAIRPAGYSTKSTYWTVGSPKARGALGLAQTVYASPVMTCPRKLYAITLLKKRKNAWCCSVPGVHFLKSQEGRSTLDRQWIVRRAKYLGRKPGVETAKLQFKTEMIKDKPSQELRVERQLTKLRKRLRALEKRLNPTGKDFA